MPCKCTFYPRGGGAGGSSESRPSVFQRPYPRRGNYGALGGAGSSADDGSSAEADAAFGAAPAARGGYGALGGGRGRYGALGGAASEADNRPEMMKRPSKLERMPTYAAIEAVKPRPVTLATFDYLGKEDEKEEEAPGAQSARAAFRSWSITGGTRDASFRKRQTGGGSSLALLALPAGSKKPRSVGFASVLSMSGWSENDAEEVDVKPSDLNSFKSNKKAGGGAAAGTSVLTSSVEEPGIEGRPSDPDPYPSSDEEVQEAVEGLSLDDPPQGSFVKKRDTAEPAPEMSFKRRIS